MTVCPEVRIWKWMLYMQYTHKIFLQIFSSVLCLWVMVSRNSCGVCSTTFKNYTLNDHNFNHWVHQYHHLYFREPLWVILFLWHLCTFNSQSAQLEIYLCKIGHSLLSEQLSLELISHSVNVSLYYYSNRALYVFPLFAMLTSPYPQSIAFIPLGAPCGPDHCDTMFCTRNKLHHCFLRTRLLRLFGTHLKFEPISSSNRLERHFDSNLMIKIQSVSAPKPFFK